MAASMNFKPGGYDDDEDDGEFDGFYLSSQPSILQQLDAVSQNNSASGQTSRRIPGGFGKPEDKVAPTKHFKRSRDVKMEIESKPLDIGDFQSAIMRGQLAAVKEYIDKGFLVDTVLRTGWSGLMYAASHADHNLVQMLLDHGADPNFNKDMYTVLMAACGPAGYKEGDVLQCVNLLLERGARVNDYDRYHTTALMCAAREGRSEVIRTLVTRGADMAKQDNRGWTVLSWAVSKRHRGAVVTLLELGADPYQCHSDGSTIIQMAEYDGLDQMVELLQGKKRTGTVSVDAQDTTNENTGQDDSSNTVYGELELFLCGLDLTRLIGLFRQQQVDFPTFLMMNEEDLIKMGVTQIGVRRKILEGIRGVHNKEWENSSLVQVPHRQMYSCAEVLANIANISKHTKYISATVGVMQSQLQKNPKTVEDLPDGTGPMQLYNHTVDSLKNISQLQQRLNNLRTVLEEKLPAGNYTSPDAISMTTSQTNNRRKLYWSAAVIATLAVGLLLWKQDVIKSIHTVPHR